MAFPWCLLVLPRTQASGNAKLKIVYIEGLQYEREGTKNPLPMLVEATNRARSSAGEHLVDIEGVTGSIPVVPTMKSPALPAGLFLWHDIINFARNPLVIGLLRGPGPP